MKRSLDINELSFTTPYCLGGGKLLIINQLDGIPGQNPSLLVGFWWQNLYANLLSLSSAKGGFSVSCPGLSN